MLLLGLELVPLVSQIFNERNILVRGIAHPMMFAKRKTGRLPEISSFDTFRIMGVVPVAPFNLFKLLSSKSHVVLYPGGMREALHRKVVIDYDDLVKIPYFKSEIESLTNEAMQLRWKLRKESFMIFPIYAM
ncbi:acyltransferase-like protein At3g26840, chloroplastic [Trifolium pratense]|uniref:acyltransferase-like protein At3g26840, chloroplastic n=1 Tax=Trifolium pratense TaxID=57577 RepID=UPI001E690028|nr:acyltransferase-like protein At3g26840, chloroplastic [Trifolium pratense]